MCLTFYTLAHLFGNQSDDADLLSNPLISLFGGLVVPV